MTVAEGREYRCVRRRTEVPRQPDTAVRAGISTADTLRMATIDPARAKKLEKKTGSIAVGKAADLVVVDGDPLAHIEEIGS